MTRVQRAQGKRQRSRVLLQVPLTEIERRALKHQAIDEGRTVGEVVRVALGLPATIDVREGAAM